MSERSSIPRLDDGAKSYYKRVESFLDGEEEEGGKLFLKNVAEQVIRDGAVRVCCDKDGSRAVERLLQQTVLDVESIQKLFKGLSPEYYNVIMNKCGSHVVEALLKAAAILVEANRLDPPEDLVQDIFSLCATIREHMAEFITHPYASHVFSALVQVLSGVHLSDHVNRSRYSQEFRNAKMSDSASQRRGMTFLVPKSFTKKLKGISKQLTRSRNLNELLTHQCANPVLQTMLRVLKGSIPTFAKRLIKKIVKYSKPLSKSDPKSSESGSDTHSHPLPELFTDVVGSHLMECTMEVAPKNLLSPIYEGVFKGSAMKFALHPVANYPLQKFLISAHISQVSKLIDELVPLEEILFADHTGVVVKLAQAAVSCSKKQSTFFQDLMRAFHTDTKPTCCVPLFLSLTTYEVMYDKTEEQEEQFEPICLHGSLLVQALLKFKDTKTVVKSLLSLSQDDIVRMSCHPSGSHVITTFMTSTTVNVEKKQMLVSMLKVNLVPLCKDKHGSRVVDVVWTQSNVPQKKDLAEILLANEEELAGDFFGRIVLSNCNISHYKRKQALWQEQQRRTERKRSLFKDIITEEEGPPKKKTKTR